MNIGKLRHRVSLQSDSTAQNNFGEQIAAWAVYDTVWARIEPLAGRELELARQITSETNHRITIRYNSSVSIEHQVVFGGRIFEITSLINPEERNEYLILLCKEITL